MLGRDLGSGGKVTLKWYLKKLGGFMCHGFMWLNMEKKMAGCC